MSIATDITRIQNAKNAIRTAINNKGGSVSTSAKIDTYATAINNLSTQATFEHFHDSVTSSLKTKDFTLPANKAGYILAEMQTGLHWHMIIQVAGTRIVETKGTSDIGSIDYVASGWNCLKGDYVIEGTRSTRQRLLTIPASTTQRTIRVQYESAYGGNIFDAYFGK